MNPADRPELLTPERAEWVPASPEAIEVRVFGTWHGPTVPPRPRIVVGTESVEAQAVPPGPDVPPAWSASFRLPSETRVDVEAGAGVLLVGSTVVGVPPATPGRLDPPVVVDPLVLAERRARRVEAAATTEREQADEASTLRAQLRHLEERLARSGEERDALASRVADAERRLRLAEQREESERRRRGELEEDLAVEGREIEEELHELRDRLASAEEVTEVLERELATARHREEVERTGRLRLDAELADVRRRLKLTESAVAGGAAAVAERDALKLRVAELADEVETLRVELASRPLGGGDEVAALEAELARERAAHAATEHARASAAARTQVERAAREEAERLAAAAGQRPDAELARQVAELEAELARRAEIHTRVQAAIVAIQDDLARVRAQVDERRSPDMEALAGRYAQLEAELTARTAELASVRTALTEAQASTRDAERVADELRDRLERERAEWAAAAAAAAPEVEEEPAPAPAPEPEDALDALLTGLRAQVESAREQLDEWDAAPAAERPAVAPPDEATRARLEAIEADIRAAVPPAEEVPSPAKDLIASLQEAADRLRSAAEGDLGWIDEPDEPAAPSPPTPAAPSAAAPSPPAPPAPPPAEAPAPRAPEARPSAAPPEVVSVDVAPATPPPAPRPAPAVTVAPVVTEADRPRMQVTALLKPVDLRPRTVADSARETTWLRTAVERLAVSDPTRARELFLALLPAQAMLDQTLTYVLDAPGLGRVRVALEPGRASLEPGATDPEADAQVAGPLAALAPLAAGGAPWRLKGVKVEGARRALRKLARARRRPLTLADLALMQPAVSPEVLLAALAAAVDPVWTEGHKFAVSYVVEGLGAWTVVADDGRPLVLVQNEPEHPVVATVRLDAGAVVPALQGVAPPPDTRASVVGGTVAADVLHGWFDRARGVTAR